MGQINDLRENGYKGPKPFQVDYLNGFGKALMEAKIPIFSAIYNLLKLDRS